MKPSRGADSLGVFDWRSSSTSLCFGRPKLTCVAVDKKAGAKFLLQFRSITVLESWTEVSGHCSQKSADLLREVVKSLSGLELLTQHASGFGLIAKLLIGLIHTDNGTGARGKTTIGIQRDAVGFEMIERLAHSARDGFG